MIIITAIRVVAAVLHTIFMSLLAIGAVIIRSMSLYHSVARTWARGVLRIFGITVTLDGADRIVPGTTYIYVSNHASMFDIPAVLAGIPDDIHIMLKKELTRVPIWGWSLAWGPYIVIDRYKARSASESLDEAAGAIRSGKSVLIFAEGTRTRTGALLPFKRGAFAIAARSGVPIIPVAINNTFSILQKGSLNVRSAPITLCIGTPLQTEGTVGRDGERMLLDQTRGQIEEMYVEQHA